MLVYLVFDRIGRRSVSYRPQIGYTASEKRFVGERLSVQPSGVLVSLTCFHFSSPEWLSTLSTQCETYLYRPALPDSRQSLTFSISYRMALHMRIPKTCAKPGAYINGTLTVRPDAGMDFDVEILTVTLLGLSETCITTGSGHDQLTEKSSDTFLKLEKTMEKAPLVLGSGCVRHFYLIFPDDPGFIQHDPKLADLPHVREKPKPQVLPPSGDFGSGNSIVYRVDASLVDKNSQREIKATTLLDFSPTRTVDVPDPQTVSIVRKQLFASEYGGECLEIYKLALDGPQTVVQEQPFPITLRLEDEHSQATYTTLPTLSMNKCVVELLATTVIQDRNKSQDSWTTEYTIASRMWEPNTSAPCITAAGLDLGMLLGPLFILKQHEPSFECNNIQRTYCIAVSVEVGHEVGAVAEIRFQTDLLTLLAAEYVGTEIAKEDQALRERLAARPSWVPVELMFSNDDDII